MRNNADLFWAGYLRHRPFEEKLYTVLGVTRFIRLTPTVVWEKLRGKRPKAFRTKKWILRYYRETMLNEMAHLISLLVLLAVAIYAFISREWAAGALLLLGNILINLYPVFLMRLNRIRIARALGKDSNELLKEVLGSNLPMESLIAYFQQSGFTVPEAREVAGFFKRKTFAKGEHFLAEGKTARHLAFISRGLFQFYFLRDGDEHTTYVVGENNFLASLSSFIGQVPAREYVRALNDSEVWQIHFDDVQYLKNHNPRFQTFYTGVLEHLLICIDDSRHKLIALTAEERYKALLDEEPELLQEIPLQYLASILGVTPRHLSRIRNNIR